MVGQYFSPESSKHPAPPIFTEKKKRNRQNRNLLWYKDAFLMNSKDTCRQWGDKSLHLNNVKCSGEPNTWLP